MRLKNRALWPLPVVLDVTADFAKKVKSGDSVALRDPEGLVLAVIHIEEIWEPNRESEVESLFGATDRRHPGVSQVLDNTHPIYVSGKVEGVQPPLHYDFQPLRLTPSETREKFEQLGWTRIVAFQPTAPLHRADFEFTLRAANEASAGLLIHPIVGITRTGDAEHYTRVRCHEAVLPQYPANFAALALLPFATRMAGSREALWQAAIAKNYGCTHFIIGQEYVGAHELFEKHKEELGVTTIPFRKMVYLENKDTFVHDDEVENGNRYLSLSPAGLRHLLDQGRDIPGWFTYPSVASELQRAHIPRHEQGFTVFFTGLSGSGKSTIANILLVKLLEMGGRSVTLLDGDIVRKNLSSELGFSKEHRDLNIRRIGFVAREITRSGGIAVCAPIAPYDNVRKDVRHLFGDSGGFILVHISTPLEICEQRDRKGLYAKARAGIIPTFTGVSDPYEAPTDAEVVIDTLNLTPEESAQRILLHLKNEGYVR